MLGFQQPSYGFHIINDSSNPIEIKVCFDGRWQYHHIMQHGDKLEFSTKTGILIRMKYEDVNVCEHYNGKTFRWKATKLSDGSFEIFVPEIMLKGPGKVYGGITIYKPECPEKKRA